MIVCFDVDGTLDCGGGPVPVARLNELVAQGHAMIIVSTSLNRPQGFVEVLSRMYKRKDSLEEVKKRYPQGGLFLYVSDNPGDDEVCRATGFTYVRPEDFRQDRLKWGALGGLPFAVSAEQTT